MVYGEGLDGDGIGDGDASRTVGVTGAKASQRRSASRGALARSWSEDADVAISQIPVDRPLSALYPVAERSVDDLRTAWRGRNFREGAFMSLTLLITGVFVSLLEHHVADSGDRRRIWVY